MGKKKNNGRKYEDRCVRYFRSKGYRIMKVTKASHDQGVDIIAKKLGKLYAIQCKCYDHPVGNKAVQEAYSGKEYYGCDRAIAVTNTTFTKPAKELAEKVDVKLIERLEFGGHGVLVASVMLMVIAAMILLILKFAPLP